jgi:hypothetical protein
VGDFTIHNAGYPVHEDGKCAGTAGFTFADAVAACGGDVKYFSYTCSDFPAKRPYQPEPELAWTSYYGCCACDASTCPSPRVCDGNVCGCPAPEALCAGQCVDTTSDPNNCGACGDVCPAGDTCIMGQCSGCNAVTCPPPGVCMGEVCTGGCNPMTCLPPNACVNGSECLLCTAPGAICGGECANLETDPNNCGACGNACPAGDVCGMGACVAGCVPQTCAGLGASCGDVGDGCGGVLQCGDCMAPLTCGGGGEPNVCGGPTCQPVGAGCMTSSACCTMSCQDGVCECGPGTTACMGVCEDLQTDPANCGMCFNACPMGSACIMGTCE